MKEPSIYQLEIGSIAGSFLKSYALGNYFHLVIHEFAYSANAKSVY